MRNPGQSLLVCLLLILLVINTGRAFFAGEEGPVFLPVEPGGTMVELGAGFSRQGIYQFIDGAPLADVILLTNYRPGDGLAGGKRFDARLEPGQRIDLEINNDIIKGLRITWMSSAKRIALGIPLHPDRMCEEDWEVLPGIGEKMARRIEESRQKYGEFGAFDRLIRVQGIGKKRLSHWNQYFF